MALDTSRHRRAVLPNLLLFAGVFVACAPRRPASVAKCGSDGHVYTLADTAHGVNPAHLQHLRSRLPASDWVKLQILVTAQGTALPESTRVESVDPKTAEAATRHVLEQAD